MTSEEQLGFWIEGKSIHNGRDRKEGECCPDFSCCFPGLLAPYDQRVAFRDATGAERDAMLFGFLGAALPLMVGEAKAKKAYIAGGPVEEQ